MSRWQQLVRLPGAELARLDVAAMNLACAEGLPGPVKIEAPLCLRTLDRYAARVAEWTGRAAFERKPGCWDHSFAIYRIHAMISVLQREFGVRYNPAKIPSDAPFGFDEFFIHGIIQGEGGTCGTLPVLYAAIGQRLGYPLKLVTCRNSNNGHLFVRWDEPGGERFNVEVNNEGFDCPPDEYYRTAPYQTHPQWEATGSILKSMGPTEVLAEFLAQRAAYAGDVEQKRCQAEALAWACALAPHNVFYKLFLARAIEEWAACLAPRLPPGFPGLFIHVPPRQFPPTLLEKVERDLAGLTVTEFLLSDPEKERQWWGPMRRGERLRRRLTSYDVRCRGGNWDIEEHSTSN